jgi:hypothetical protein
VILLFHHNLQKSLPAISRNTLSHLSHPDAVLPTVHHTLFPAAPSWCRGPHERSSKRSKLA